LYTALVHAREPATLMCLVHALREVLRPTLEPDLAPAEAPGPDVLTWWSRRLEDEVSTRDCAAIERHVAVCRRCSDACDALRRALGACQRTGASPLDTAVQTRVRSAVRAAAVATASTGGLIALVAVALAVTPLLAGGRARGAGLDRADSRIGWHGGHPVWRRPSEFRPVDPAEDVADTVHAGAVFGHALAGPADGDRRGIFGDAAPKVGRDLRENAAGHAGVSHFRRDSVAPGGDFAGGRLVLRKGAGVARWAVHYELVVEPNEIFGGADGVESDFGRAGGEGASEFHE
jgi:hypothetical protein